MTVSKSKRRYRVIVKVVLTVVGISVLVLGVSLLFYRIQIARMSSVVQEKAARSQAREYQRDPDTPGWVLEDGRAAEYYERAWDSCWPYSPTGGDRRSRGRMIAEVTGRPWTGQYSIVETEAAVITPECEALGVTAENMDPVTAQLHPEFCDLYTSCQDALELIRRGTRQSDMRAPGNIWSSWLIEPGSDYPRMWAMITGFPKLELLRAHLAGQQGDRPKMLASWASSLRFGADLSRGSGYMGTTTREIVQRDVLLAIGQDLLRDTLTLGEAQQLAAELAYVRRQPINRKEWLEDQQVAFASIMPLDQDLVVPGFVMGSKTKLPPKHAALLVLGISGILDIWDRQLEIQELPYPARYRANQDLWDDAADHWNPAVEGYVWPPVTETRLAAHESHLLLTEIAVTETIYRRLHGQLPATPMDLKSVNQDLDLIDPLSDEEIQLVEQDGRRFLRSPAHDHDRWTELGINDWLNNAHGNGYGDSAYLQVELPAPASPL